MKYDAILEGGGVKIPGLAGALHAIETRGFTPSHLAGTSAGSIVAAARVAGFEPLSIKEILMDLDFNRFLDGGYLGAKAYNVFRHKGLYKGDELYWYMQKLLASKGVHHYGDLKDPTESGKYLYRLKVYASDLTRGRLVTWPDDAGLYGMNPEYLDVAWTVRCSMSIPFFFRPVIHNNHYFVDGGLLSNFPIWQWDSIDTPAWPTFGILLHEQDDSINKNDGLPHNMIMSMINTMMKAHDKRFIRKDEYEYRTIRVPTQGVRATNFDISNEKKLELFNHGVMSAGAMINNWNFEDYVAWANRTRGLIV